MNHPPGTPHRKQLYAVIAARPPRRTLQGCTPAERPVEPAGRTVPDRARDCAVWAGCQAACAEAAGLGCGADRPMRAHMHPAHRRPARATAGRERAFCCCCCCCCWHATAVPAAAAAPPIPPGGPQPPGATPEHTGARTPSCPRSARPRAHTTSERARSPLPALGQTICGSLSAGRSGDAQTAANHGQQAKGSRTTRAARQRNVRQRAPIRPRGGGRHKGACEGRERDWDGGFCSSPVSHVVPGLLLDSQQRHLRQILVDGAPQTVVVVAD